MHGRIMSLRGSRLLPQPRVEFPERPLELVVPVTSPALAAQALAAAAELARGSQSAVTLMAVHVLPYPSPLECPAGMRERLEADLTAIARTAPVAARVNLIFARSREEAYLALLPRHSLVVMGVKHRWWPTGEDRFARKLASAGHSVAVIRVR